MKYLKKALAGLAFAAALGTSCKELDNELDRLMTRRGYVLDKPIPLAIEDKYWTVKEGDSVKVNFIGRDSADNAYRFSFLGKEGHVMDHIYAPGDTIRVKGWVSADHEDSTGRKKITNVQLRPYASD